MPRARPFLPLLSALALLWFAASAAHAVVTANDAWHPLGNGDGVTPGANVWSTFATSNGTYISGSFVDVDDVPANRVAFWNGATWSALGSGLNGDGDDIVSNGTTTYVVGKFSLAGGNPAVNVAAWNGSAWSALAGGVANYPYAATIHNGSLYVGGGNPAWVQKWNGTSWETITTGANGWVYSLCSYDGKLAIGGDFTDLGSGVNNDYLVLWDGTNLSAPGTINFVVAAMAVDTVEQDLYVSGQFTAPTGFIGRWNGTAWSTLGSGLSGGAASLVFADDILYAVGGFTAAGGSPAAKVASWNGTTWSALGSGANGDVYAACMSTQGLAIAGMFTTAGGKFARGVALHNATHFAQDLAFLANAGVAHTGTLSASRETGTPLTIAIAAPPSHGTLVLNNAATGAFTYTATAGYNGSDQFLFTGSDMDGTSNSALVAITVVSGSGGSGGGSSSGGSGGGCGLGATASGLMLMLFGLMLGRAHRWR